MIPLDPVLAIALQKRDELQQELQKIEDFLRTYRTLAKSIEGTLSPIRDTSGQTDAPKEAVRHLGMEEARAAETPHEPPPKRVRVSDNPKPTLVVSEAAKVIRAAGKPMTRRAIHKALSEKGVVVKGADPIKALGTILWRSGKGVLVQIEGWGYGLAGVEYDLSGTPPLRKGWRLTRPSLTA